MMSYKVEQDTSKEDIWAEGHDNSFVLGMTDMVDVPDVLRKIAPRNDTTKLSDQVVAEIERLILSGELREGEKLPTEAELCQAFGMSRSVIRDAVRTLSARGLVRVQHGQGTVVDPPGESTVADALILHLLRATNLPALEVMLRPLQHVVMLSSVPPYVDRPEFWEASAHQAILDGIRARDEDRTRQALRDHYMIMETPAYAETQATSLRDAPMVHEVLQRIRRGKLFS